MVNRTLTGQYQRVIDEKLRIAIPKPLRRQLSQEEDKAEHMDRQELMILSALCKLVWAYICAQQAVAWGSSSRSKILK